MITPLTAEETRVCELMGIAPDKLEQDREGQALNQAGPTYMTATLTAAGPIFSITKEEEIALCKMMGLDYDEYLKH